MKKYFFILLTFVAITLVLYFLGQYQKQQSVVKQQNNTIFDTILFNSSSNGVTHIQGFKNQPGKFDTFLKFSFTPESWEKLMKLHEYKKIDCEGETMNKLSAPHRIKNFVEGSTRWWNIDDVEQKECYATFLFTPSGIEGKFYNNALRQRAQSEFLVDKENNIIYFHESGI